MAAKNYALRTLLIILIVSLFFSCDFLLDDEKDSSDTFQAKDFTTRKDYSLKAELAASGRYCNVWVEKNNSTGKSQAKEIADAYDNKVHSQMINAFGLKNPAYNSRTFSDIMKFADYLGDGDGKLCILLLDIRDNYKKGVNESYVSGYFWAGNFIDMPGSNYRDIIFIDTNPGMENGQIEYAISTLAHEMQHLMNFVTSVIKRSETKNGSVYVEPMDTWIDEGLSSAAEYIYNNGNHSEDRISWYNENGNSKLAINGMIDQGNNFFVWGNHANENIYAELDDYATVYLFFQWLRIQKGGLDIWRDIISSSYYDYQAVTTTAKENWDDLLKNWMAANYINASAGEWGYKGEIPITTHYAPEGKKSISLFPAEGVYSLTDASDTLPSQNVNIKYAGLNKTSGFMNDSVVYASGALLTYNKNVDLEAKPETGITTGKVPSANIMPAGGRSVMSSYSGPFRIGGGNMLTNRWTQNGFELWNFKE
jgi:hypothetical protein